VEVDGLGRRLASQFPPMPIPCGGIHGTQAKIALEQMLRTSLFIHL